MVNCCYLLTARLYDCLLYNDHISNVTILIRVSLNDSLTERFLFRFQVHRYDAPAPMGRCRVTGDPHVETFDGVFYDIFTTGNFIYARNLANMPVEVSVLLCD